MKPPKSVRNIVHTLLGKKSKSLSKEPQGGFQDSFLSANSSLGKSARHHRSADDLSKEGPSDVNGNHISPATLTWKSRSLPRRSQSCLTARPSKYRQPEQSRGMHVVSGTENHLWPDFRAEDLSRNRSFSLPRSQSRKSNPSQIIWPRITNIGKGGDFGVGIPQTTSWNHPGFGNSRTASFNLTSENSERNSWGNAPYRKQNRSLSSCEQLHTADPCQARWTVESYTKAPREETNEKLKTCLQVLDQLSAQVKEIKDVSKRVKYVDTKIKNGKMGSCERERRLQELGMAEAASQRLKQQIRTGADTISSTRRNSSNSSGSDIESGKTVSFLDEAGRERRSRARGRMTQTNTDHSHLGQTPGAIHQGSQPYPQSVSDMMFIWDAKDMEALSNHHGRHMIREDSASSGYATGSGSEDDRQDSPNAIDADSTGSVFSVQGGQPLLHHNYEATGACNRRHFSFPPYQGYGGYAQESYDPFSIYGSHPQHVPVADENLHGTCADVYGYAPSSAYDYEIYANGWYQLQSANNCASSQYNHAATSVAPPAAPSNLIRSQLGHARQPARAKYGGLSDLFYDPTAPTDATLMESIVSEVATESQTMEEPAWKSYGSFRYRNGQRRVTVPADRRRKTVRFSPTVRQRVETEESELKDSTSAIKDGEEAEQTQAKEPREEDSSEIYMSPRQHQCGQFLSVRGAQESEAVNHQNPLPEPIYEFPSGHIETSCMCSDCILARGSSQISATKAVSYFS